MTSFDSRSAKNRKKATVVGFFQCFSHKTHERNIEMCERERRPRPSLFGGFGYNKSYTAVCVIFRGQLPSDILFYFIFLLSRKLLLYSALGSFLM